jgi:hypothetical protein
MSEQKKIKYHMRTNMTIASDLMVLSNENPAAAHTNALAKSHDQANV